MTEQRFGLTQFNARALQSAKLATSTAKCVRTHLEREADQGRAEACVLRPGFVSATLARRFATGH